MLTLDELKHAANEAITDCGSEVEMLHKVEKIKAALKSGSEFYKQLGYIKLRLNRILAIQAKGVEPIEYFDVQINRVQNSILESISNLKYQEVCVPFEYDYKKGIIYLLCDSNGDLLYRFYGSLFNGKPDGIGEAKYTNGEYFEGMFKGGMREGLGKLFDKSHRLVKDGIWKNDKFIKKHAIDFFSSESVAAGYIKEGDSISAIESELMIIPGISQSGLLAFPVSGDSMLPTFSEGDIVVCQELTSLFDLKDNQIYVIFHNDTLFLKVVQKVSSIDDNIVLRLMSENYIKYQPFEIVPDEHTKVYKMILQIIKY